MGTNAADTALDDSVTCQSSLAHLYHTSIPLTRHRPRAQGELPWPLGEHFAIGLGSVMSHPWPLGLIRGLPIAAALCPPTTSLTLYPRPLSVSCKHSCGVASPSPLAPSARYQTAPPRLYALRHYSIWRHDHRPHVSGSVRGRPRREQVTPPRCLTPRRSR